MGDHLQRRLRDSRPPAHTLNSLAATREGVWYLNSRHVTIDEGGSLNKKEMIHYSFSELIFLGSSRKFSTRAQNS